MPPKNQHRRKSKLSKQNTAGQNHPGTVARKRKSTTGGQAPTGPNPGGEMRHKKSTKQNPPGQNR